MRIGTFVAASLFLPSGMILAQYGGQYPGSGPYPPGAYPGGGIGIPGIPGIHFPKKKTKDDSNAQKPSGPMMQSVEGMLRKLDDKQLLLQAAGDKILGFRLIAKTEFTNKDGKQVRDSLQPGDHLTIDVNPDDPETAMHVTLNKSGSGKDREKASEPVLESRVMTPETADFGKPHPVKGAAAESTDSTPTESSSTSSPSSAPPPLESSSSDGRPTLHRQIESDSARPSSPDSVIDDARDAAESFSADLPNFLVQQVTTRFQGTRSGNNWRLMDTVTADVASVNGKEEYRNIKVNGRPTDRPEDSGSWSTGEFQVTLQDVLSPRTAATFTPHGEDHIANRPAYVFDLSVDQPHSHWTLVGESGRRIRPAYTGRIWIDKETRRVLRIEQVAVSIPRDFDFDKEESTLEYGFVNIDGRSYLLPVESIDVACGTGISNCSRNRIEFRNYRKFSTDANITFGN